MKTQKMYIKGVCGTESDPDDLWVMSMCDPDAIDKDVLSSIYIEYYGFRTSLYDMMTNTKSIVNAQGITLTNDLFEMFICIRSIIEMDIVKTVGPTQIDLVTSAAHFCTCVIMTAATEPNSEFYIE